MIKATKKSQARASEAAGEDRRAGSGSLGKIYEVSYPSGTEPKKTARDLRFIRRTEAQRRTYQQYTEAWSQYKEAGETGAGPRLNRTFWCGHKLRETTQFIDIRQNPDTKKAHYTNIQYCGSVWTCPVCGSMIRRVRAAEVEEAITRWQAQGRGAYLVTATLRHWLADDLATSLEVLGKAWHSTTSGKRWQRFKKDFGIAGYIRALEVTYSDANGWHPHYHFLFFTENEATAEGQRELEGVLLERWQKFVVKHGGRLPNTHGIDVRPVDHNGRAAALYVAKIAEGGNVALELSRADLKESDEAQSVTPFQLLDLDTPKHKALWNNYCQAIKGKRSVFFSRGLRERLGLSTDRTDEEIVEELENVGEITVAFEADLYETARDMGGEILGRILNLVERKDYKAITRLLGCTVEVRERIDSRTGELVNCPVFSTGAHERSRSHDRN